MAYGEVIMNIGVMVLVLGLWSGVGAAQQVPCYFIFGDSWADNGNNNQLWSYAKANYLPYGIDFPIGPTGRFSNGKTIVDVLAEFLGLSYIRPYARARLREIFNGLNYASAASGIREETGQQLGGRISFSGQVENYVRTVSQMVSLLGDESRTANYLSKCIYSIGLGSNDYLNNYFMPQLYSTSRQYTPQQYADVLIQAYAQQLRILYNYGARKMVLFGVGQIGCSPIALAQYSQDGRTCAEGINSATQLFNNGLRSLVDQLNNQLPNARFIYINIYGIFQDIIRNPSSFGDYFLPKIFAILLRLVLILFPRGLQFSGFRVTNDGCCGVGRNNGQITCVPLQAPCSNRSEFLYWDTSNPTEGSSSGNKKFLIHSLYISKAHSLLVSMTFGELIMNIGVVVMVLGLWSGFGSAQQVPCYFIFGDSLVDNGNNNQLNSLAKANYLPYGIDFPAGPTGRFSNGKTTVDVVAQLLGFNDYIRSYATARGRDILSGINYASAAAGIREETGQQLGGRISFSGQVQNYQRTVSQMVNLLGDENTTANYLSKCIYSIGMGSNDYLNNYFMPLFYSSSRQYTPQQYANVLIQAYAQQLRILYNYGARKMALFGVGQIGCSPNALAQNSPDGRTCVARINSANQLFNNGLRSLVDQLNNQLPDARFIYVNVYGFRVTNAGCCGVGRNNGQITCLPLQPPCRNRRDFLFWDAFHPTEAANSIIARRAYNAQSASDAYPVDINRLAQI
ncbi:GDSL esterase/lipase, partial [Mucuna pruriens]